MRIKSEYSGKYMQLLAKVQLQSSLHCFDKVVRKWTFKSEQLLYYSNRRHPTKNRQIPRGNPDFPPALSPPRWALPRRPVQLQCSASNSRCPRRVIKAFTADQSAAPTEEHHGGNGTRLAQEDISDTFLSPCNGAHPAGPGPRTTENRIPGTVAFSSHILSVFLRRLISRMALFYISNNGGYELA